MQVVREVLEKELANHHLNVARVNREDREWQKKKPLLMTLADNLIERSADTLSFRHNRNFEAFHLRYLSFEMR